MDDNGLCPACDGSGEGMHDGSRCGRCGGSGEYAPEYDWGDEADWRREMDQ